MFNPNPTADKLAICALYSGGKDSTYSYHWAVLKGFKVACLITIIPQSEESWLFHYPAIWVTKLQARSMRTPLITIASRTIGEDEVKDLKKALVAAKRSYNISGVVTGALLSDYQRTRINIVAEELGLKVYSPIWRINQEEYMKNLVAEGFSFIITRISVEGLSPTLLGKPITLKDVETIIELAHAYGFNPAFEGGEAETLVVDAPLFGEKIVLDGYIEKKGPNEWMYVIRKAFLKKKK